MCDYFIAKIKVSVQVIAKIIALRLNAENVNQLYMLRRYSKIALDKIALDKIARNKIALDKIDRDKIALDKRAPSK